MRPTYTLCDILMVAVDGSEIDKWKRKFKNAKVGEERRKNIEEAKKI